MATAEAYVVGGVELTGPAAPRLFGELLARLVKLAPAPTKVPPLNPRPRWLRWVPHPGQVVIGHGDWESHNIQWVGEKVLAVHDWDSAVAMTEPELAGAAAAVFPATSDGKVVAATIDETAEFLRTYQRARLHLWTREQERIAWECDLRVLMHNAERERRGQASGYLAHLEAEGDERWKRSKGCNSRRG